MYSRFIGFSLNGYARSQKLTYQNEMAKKTTVSAIKIRSDIPIPPLFAARPPDEADGRRVLFFFQEARRLCQEKFLVRKIAPPLDLHQKTVCELKIRRQSGFLQRLRKPAEQPAPVREIFCPP